MLVTFAETFRDALIPFLIGGTATLLLMLLVLIGQRLIRAASEVRRRSLTARYQPVIDDALATESMRALDAAELIPARHRGIASDLLLSRMRVVRGRASARAAVLAEVLALAGHWRADVRSRRWWRRAEAALALGLIRDHESVPALHRLLDDDHEQVRAAAIDALGQIREPASLGALLARLRDPGRHERTRLVEALRAYGDRAAEALIAHGRRHEPDRAMVAGVLAFIGGPAAGETLLEWANGGNAEVQAAAWAALATVGFDTRAFYHAVKALSTGTTGVRAAAARAIGRSGREDAAPYLAARLDDEWEIAAHASRALAGLGHSGVAALRARIERGPGLGHDLAQQMLWEGRRR